MPLFYALTLFVSAFLLFLVQPLVGKMLLPLVGGTPVVWNTCMVFFQIMLLAGYLYAHTSTKYLSSRRQVALHIALLLLTLGALGVAAVVAGKPIAVSAILSPQGDRIPVFGMLLVLVVAVGLPFFTVATSAPLLQRWFSHTGHPAAKDPYFLYGASNLGSVLALLAYPLLPEFGLRDARVSWLWAGGFGVLALLVVGCGGFLMRAPAGKSLPESAPASRSAPQMAEPVSWSRRLRWIALAFAPSSLMLGVTTYLATDIASIPLLWVIPLGLYLLTFIIAFSRLPGWFHTGLSLAAPVLLLVLVFFMLSGIAPRPRLFWMFGLHLVTFFVAALACHCDLARSRPATAHLTEFYLLMSVGGVLGGLFNALIAPLIFDGVYEYRIALVAACLVLPSVNPSRPTGRTWFFDVVVVSSMFVLAMFLSLQIYRGPNDGAIDLWYRRPVSMMANGLSDLLDKFDLPIYSGHLFNILAFGVPALICFIFVERPLRFGLCVGALFLGAHLCEQRSNVVLQKRSFFGVLKINKYGGRIYDPDEGQYRTVSYHELIHGTTLHGREIIESPYPYDVGLPISYYHEMGPIGDVFAHLSKPREQSGYAVVGLGTGTLAGYAKKGQKVTYYEIDPLVKSIAENPKYFTFVDDARKRGAQIDIVMGDARVQMERRKNDRYGMIFVDAFSSDSIPIHLLTREAIRLYFDRLEPDGILILHISNRYLDLGPVVAKLAEDAQLTAWLGEDVMQKSLDKDGSNWVVLARRRELLGILPTLVRPRFEVEQDDGRIWYEKLDSPENAKRRMAFGVVGGAMIPLVTYYRWVEMHAEPDDPLWEDDYSNPLKIVKWR